MLYQTCVFLSLLVAFGPPAAEKPEIPPRIRAYLAQQPTPAEKVVAIKKLQKELGEYRQTVTRIRRGKISRVQTEITIGRAGVITFPSREARLAKAKEVQDQLTEATARLKGLRNGTAVWFAPMRSNRPTVGDIGRLPDGRGFHIQVIGPRDMRINTFWWGAVHPLTGVRMKSQSTDLWVKGIATDGFTDSRGIDLPGVFEITGTKTYPTAIGGTNTVFVIEPIDLTPYLPPNNPKAPVPPKPN